MKKEQLERGNHIQSLLYVLKSQLNRLQKPHNTILSELASGCNGSVDSELEDLESNLKEIAIKSVKLRIAKLENEFNKL